MFNLFLQNLKNIVSMVGSLYLILLTLILLAFLKSATYNVFKQAGIAQW